MNGTESPRLATRSSLSIRPLCLALILSMLACASATSIAAVAPEPKTPVDLKAVADIVHERINAIRAEHGLKPLARSPELAAIALGHSRDMAGRGYFSHDSPEGVQPHERAEAAGFTCRVPVGGNKYQGIGENIFQITAYESIRRTVRQGQVSERYNWFAPQAMAGKIVQGWMNSPPHRAVILNRHFSKAGLGLAYSPRDKTVYITHNFC